jgi:adenylate cyclase
MRLTKRQQASMGAVLEPLDRGDYLVAYDHAREMLEQRPNDRRAQYLAVLSLARAGATESASEKLESYGLVEVGDDDPGLRIDVAALRARLAKDLALQNTGSERERFAAEAAERYEDAVAVGGDAYCCVNAATMWLLGAQPRRTERLALEGLRRLDRNEPATAEERYWHSATHAEAALLLRRLDDVETDLIAAARASGRAVGPQAVTRRQLSIICDVLGISADALAPLRVPDVIHYCGHIPPTGLKPSRADEESEEGLAEEIGRYLDSRDVGFAYGSLASGSDVLIAEALLERDVELTVVLPFALDEFIAISVAPSAGRWVERFHACLNRARTVLYATDAEFLGDTSLFDYCAQMAMGQALIRASSLDAHVEQLAVWDGADDDGVGTGSNVKAWRATGQPSTVIPWRGRPRRPAPIKHTPSGREIRAILFCDMKGFSRLGDRQMQPFLDAVMAPLGSVLGQFEAQVLHRNTWGDGLHIVLSSVSGAADCALALQDSMRRCDLIGAGLPPDLGLRIGAHVGPVFKFDDPIRNEVGFCGTQITRTARIEPRTPEGEVYASAPFAALAALDSGRRFSCEYVGHIPLAKGFGRYPMYVIKHRRSTGP